MAVELSRRAAKTPHHNKRQPGSQQKMLSALKMLNTGHYFWLGSRTLTHLTAPTAVYYLLLVFSPQDYSFKTHTLN